MCVTFVWLNSAAGADEWKLVLINNRDEAFDRPTVAAAFDANGILCGRDATAGKEGGTWLGVDRRGRVGVLVNILQAPKDVNPNAKGRGNLVTDFLLGGPKLSPTDFVASLNGATEFNGFAMVLLDSVAKSNPECLYFTNMATDASQSTVSLLNNGAYCGISNSVFQAPFQKARQGSAKFKSVVERHESIQSRDVLIEELIYGILKDRTRNWPDVQMRSQTDEDESTLECLSSCYIEYPPGHRYGTRTHTVLLIDGENRATYVESTMTDIPKDIAQAQWNTQKFEFAINDNG